MREAADERRAALGDPLELEPALLREIAAWASRRASPLIVVGHRGADDAPPGSLGSVARELLTRAPFPVLAVNGP